MATPAEVQAQLYLTPMDPQIFDAVNLPDGTNVSYYVGGGAGYAGRALWVDQAIATAAATQAANLRTALAAFR